jgi:D-sedoheptulose 7-phosphate isomerase
MDLEKNELRHQDYDEPVELSNLKTSRYYPVIRHGLEYFNDKKIYNFNTNKVLLESQELTLNILEKSKNINAIKHYNQGDSPYEIFQDSSISHEKLSRLNNSSFKSFFEEYSEYLGDILKEINKEGLNEISEKLLEARKNGNTVFFVGNGGSAATASHFSEDLAEVGRKIGCNIFNCISLTDNVAAITAAANDHGYDKIFSFQMQGIFKKGDILIAISASGNSPNVVEAAKTAKEKGGVVIGLTGFDGGRLKELSDYSFHATSQKGEYGPVEDVHMIFDHVLTSYFYYKLKGELNHE